MHEPELALPMAAAVAIAPGVRPPRAKAAPNSAGRASVTRAVAQYAAVGPATPGTALDVPACTLTVSMPDVVKPLAAASMQALSKLEEGVPAAVDGQLALAPQ